MVSNLIIASKPSYPAGTGAGFSGGLNALVGKRDSMGKYMASASSKDQLHTLVEEEEEEEEDESSKNKEQAIAVPDFVAQGPTTPVSFTVAVTKPSPARHRPASLNLRPLALTSGCIINPVSGSLPTPTLTPGPKSSGLKSLSLSVSPCAANSNTNDTTISTTSMRRQSLILPSSPISTSGIVNRRTSLNITCDSSSPMISDGVKRQSSISYKCSIDSTVGRFTGLPTPEMTPIQSERKQLDCTAGDDLSPSRRPLSASEQHFLFKSHNALLARITDLENALSSRSRSRSWSRPVSVASDVSSNSASEPSDEMLSLIADLKAERDELKRDVDGWRTRVADLDDKVGVFAKRVEAERREAWVARSHLGLLEIEKNGLEKALRDKTVCFQEALGKLDAITEERDNLKADNKQLREQVKNAQDVEDECTRLKAALEEEMQKREDLEKALDTIDVLSTPTPETSVRNRRLFKSLDSEASLTDVEPCDDAFTKITPLKAVAEEEEDAYVHDDSYESDEDNGLAGYEDEEDSDISFQSPGSSVGSLDEYTRASLRLNMPSTPSLIVSDTSTESASPCALTPSVVKHAAHNSLSRTWTFPIGSQSNPAVRHELEEIDRFFGCLDDLESSPPMGFRNKEVNGKSLFSQSLGSSSDIGSDDEMPPFVLPSHVGVEVDTSSRILDVVLEEEEEEEEQVVDLEDINEEFQGEEFEGGIRFTFNTPSTPIIAVTPPMEALLTQAPLPQTSQVFVPFDDEEYEAEVPFTFSKFQTKTSTPASSSFDDSDSDYSVLARNVSPSSIPRSTALKSFTSTLASSTPTKGSSKRFTPPPGQSASAFMTPPSKRGGIMPSFIPQPVASPSKPLAPAKSNAPTSTFMRQPLHKPTIVQSRKANGSSFKPQTRSTSRPNSFSPRVFHSQRCDKRSF